MKSKIIALALICTTSFSVLAGCSESNSTVSEPTTVISTEPTTEVAPIERDDIDFVASYDKESKEINTTLTNNTCDDIICYDHMYDLYKKADDNWESIGFNYATYSMAYYLFPDNGINSVDLDFSAYNTAGENINFTEEKEKGGLDAGEYKITMTFDVYPESEAKTLPLEEGSTYPSENPEGKYIDTKTAKHEKVMVSAEFTVS